MTSSYFIHGVTLMEAIIIFYENISIFHYFVPYHLIYREARIILLNSKSYHVTPQLKSPQWLPYHSKEKSKCITMA